MKTKEEAMSEVIQRTHARLEAQERLAGTNFVAVPKEVLADWYERFCRLDDLGVLPIQQWLDMPEGEAQVRRECFRQSEMAVLTTGSYVDRETRIAIRDKLEKEQDGKSQEGSVDR